MFLPILLGSLYVDQYLQSKEEDFDIELQLEVGDCGDVQSVQINAPEGWDD